MSTAGGCVEERSLSGGRPGILDREELRGLSPAPRVSESAFEEMVAVEQTRFDVRRVTGWALARACREKLAYGRSRAHQAARVLRDRQGDDVRAYVCPFCSRWHVGHPPVGVER